jgi:hypothetical protein
MEPTEDLDKKLKQQMQIMRLKKLQKQLEESDGETDEQIEAHLRAEITEEILQKIKQSINNHVREAELPIYDLSDLVKAFRKIINHIEQEI